MPWNQEWMVWSQGLVLHPWDQSHPPGTGPTPMGMVSRDKKTRSSKIDFYEVYWCRINHAKESWICFMIPWTRPTSMGQVPYLQDGSHTHGTSFSDKGSYPIKIEFMAYSCRRKHAKESEMCHDPGTGPTSKGLVPHPCDWSLRQGDGIDRKIDY